jgi:type III secretion protein O
LSGDSVYPLQSLISLRHFREQAAEREVREAETQRRLAVAERDRKGLELEDYRLYRQKETERRWSELLGRTKSLADLDDFRAGLADLAQRELDLEMELEQEEKKVAEKTELLAQAKAALLACVKARDKLESHKDLYLAEANKESQRLEDLEMEEFRPLMGPAEQ